MNFKINTKTQTGTFSILAATIGLVLTASFLYGQWSADTYNQSRLEIRELQSRQDESIQLRQRVEGVVEALTDGTVQFANRSMAIDSRVWNLQMTWNDLRENPRRAWGRVSASTLADVDSSMDQFALAALRHRNAGYDANFGKSETLPSLVASLQHEVGNAIEAAEQEKQHAAVGMAWSSAIANGAFVSMVLLVVAFGIRSFAARGWQQQTPEYVPAGLTRVA